MTKPLHLGASAEELQQIVLDGVPVTLDALREAESVVFIEFSNGQFQLQSLPSNPQIGGSPCFDALSSR